MSFRITQTYLDFMRDKPDVFYTYVNPKGGADIVETWRYFPTGIFANGYYLLTKNGRRHPKGKFMIGRQAWRDLELGRAEMAQTSKPTPEPEVPPTPIQAQGLDVLTQQALSKLLPLMNLYKIPVDILVRKDKDKLFIPGATRFLAEVLRMSGLKTGMVEWIIDGIPEDRFQCSFELRGGMKKRSDGHKAEVAILTYTQRVMAQDRTFEVGFDLSKLSKAAMIREFGIKFIRTVNIPAPWKGTETREYDIWMDANENAFTARKGNFGNGSHGFIFKDENQAFKFVKWAVGYSRNTIKEVDLLENRFGGLSYRQWQKAYAQLEFLHAMGA